MTGGIIMVIIMVVVAPPLVMFGGAIWSAVMGWLIADDVDRTAET